MSPQVRLVIIVSVDAADAERIDVASLAALTRALEAGTTMHTCILDCACHVERPTFPEAALGSRFDLITAARPRYHELTLTCPLSRNCESWRRVWRAGRWTSRPCIKSATRTRVSRVRLFSAFDSVELPMNGFETWDNSVELPMRGFETWGSMANPLKRGVLANNLVHSTF